MAVCDITDQMMTMGISGPSSEEGETKRASK